MKKLLSTAALGVTMFLGTTEAQAQSYRTGAGVLVDFGDGSTLVGPHVKHFFQPNHAGEFSVLFGDGVTMVQANYQYQQPFAGTNGLGWYVGLGPAIAFGDGYTTFAPAAMIGLDFKIPGAPLDFSMDWRPRFFIGDNSDAAAGRFAAGFRFTF
ncbi:hypothetical protein MVI27_04415 [Chryseobacterium salipaludis]|uniref:hypothetical protein n=1 Tax=Chryseobacterium TaxID=59732 RepID=UPI001FF499BB|nr:MULTISPECIES: hypothetical protein [Chryseobacterium]MCJ8497497.1 hypothetical protein [Chryseobacterium salipaludis]MCX3295905.1 hypothetical protein [Planobacterium sp. JC490]